MSHLKAAIHREREKQVTLPDYNVKVATVSVPLMVYSLPARRALFLAQPRIHGKPVCENKSM